MKRTQWIIISVCTLGVGALVWLAIRQDYLEGLLERFRKEA